MATKKQIEAFIAEIAPCAQEAFRRLGKVHPSVCIAMACVESAYGTSTIMRKNNAFLGQKVGSGKTATTYWDGLSYNSRTKEEYTVGHLTTIRDNFRAYKSMQQCVFNFYELINSPVYRKRNVLHRVEILGNAFRFHFSSSFFWSVEQAVFILSVHGINASMFSGSLL